MLNKNKIDKNLKKYIREHLSKGYSRHAVRKVLVDHGYNEHYVNELFRKHSEQQFIKKYAAAAVLLFLISFFSFNLFQPQNQSQRITGHATSISGGTGGCCTSVCQQTSKDECYGKFVDTKKCSELEDCNVGCCIDKEGYCLTNYLHGNCISGYGTNVNRDCSNIVFCKNITDKSYSSRSNNLKNKNNFGASATKSSSDYYQSSFNIRYYLYDKTNVLSVIAKIKDSGQVIDSITLYDDGFHNDGAKDDSIYGNNWLSSKVKDFDGFKKLDVDIAIEYADGTEKSISDAQSITLVNNKKCLPVYGELGNASERRGIIFAAANYESVGNSYSKFESDVQAFLNIMFSIEKFSDSKGKFNFFRMDQTSHYSNVQTLINIVSGSCPSYSSKKDLLILLDNNEDYCVPEGSNAVRVNPKVLFYKNISSSEINRTFSDFCSYVLTPKKLSDEIIAFATPPTITIDTQENITYNNGFVNLSFTVSAVNYPINYSVFVENQLFFSKISSQEISDNIMLNLSNGVNAVLVQSTDRNNNKAYAQLLLNVTLK